MNTVKTIKTALISFFTLTFVLLSISAYAQDMERTMDMVQQSNQKEVTQSMMENKDMRMTARQNSDMHKNMDRDNMDKENMDHKNEDMMQSTDQTNMENMDHSGMDRENVPSKQGMHEQRHNSKKDMEHMRENRSHAREDMRHMRENTDNYREQRQQTRDRTGSQHRDGGMMH